MARVLLRVIRAVEAFSSILHSARTERQISSSRNTPRNDGSSYATDNHRRSSPLQEQIAPCLRAFVSSILKTLAPKDKESTSIVRREAFTGGLSVSWISSTAVIG